jgi:anti-sigma-K factor RskA
MNHDEDQELLAAEYVLGTLDAEERAQAQALIGINPAFAAVVRYWEQRLGELHLMVETVEPSDAVWQRIKRTIAVPEFAPERAPPAAAPVMEPLPAVEPSPVVPAGNVVEFARLVRRWQGISAVAGALAATLALFIVTLEVAPDKLPARLRPGTVLADGPTSGRFVAVLQQDAQSPAFLLTVDLAARTLAVRRVGAQQQAGKSYELWLVSNKFPAPRSLGVVGAGEFTVPGTLASYDTDVIRDATFAISLEPEGGSPTGFATGPILYLGKLVEATPRS